MKTLYLVRHAKAEEKRNGMRDFDRRLTEKGIEDAINMGKRLREESVRPDVMITSPAKRALETCELIAGELGYLNENVVFERSLFEAELDDFLEVIRGLDDAHTAVMMFGHNPSISDVAYYLCRDFTEGMSKGAAAGISLDVESWSEAGERTGKKLLAETPKNLRR
jgi:phosphohistidine phosphatase